MSQIPAVAAGAIIDPVTWGQPVADQINQRSEVIAFVPGANVDSPNVTTYGTWITVGNLTVPAWAVRAQVVCALSLVEPLNGAVGQEHELELRIGTASGRTFRVGRNFYGTAGEAGGVLVDEITLNATGTLALLVRARKVATGTAALRITTASDVVAQVTYEG